MSYTQKKMTIILRDKNLNSLFTKELKWLRERERERERETGNC